MLAPKANKIMERSGARSVVVDVTIRTFERLVRHGASWASPFLEEGITKTLDLLVDDKSVDMKRCNGVLQRLVLGPDRPPWAAVHDDRTRR